MVPPGSGPADGRRELRRAGPGLDVLEDELPRVRPRDRELLLDPGGRRLVRELLRPAVAALLEQVDLVRERLAPLGVEVHGPAPPRLDDDLEPVELGVV